MSIINCSVQTHNGVSCSMEIPENLVEKNTDQASINNQAEEKLEELLHTTLEKFSRCVDECLKYPPVTKNALEFLIGNIEQVNESLERYFNKLSQQNTRTQ